MSRLCLILAALDYFPFPPGILVGLLKALFDIWRHTKLYTQLWYVKKLICPLESPIPDL